MINELPQTEELSLQTLYRELRYDQGRLFPAQRSFHNDVIDADDWLEIGDWLQLADDVGAKNVFFVENDPVFVFCDFQYQPSLEEQRELFRRVWCMARPKGLCIALPTEIRFYSLDQPPAMTNEEWLNRSHKTIKQVTDIAQQLHEYSREQLETRRLAGDAFFGKAGQRADKQLISDLKKVRHELINDGLKPQYAHALIGRSIFIRYLEDRGVLTENYFVQIAQENSDWQALLMQEAEKIDLNDHSKPRFYTRVLRNKNFTNALFDQLSHDFNGDMFPRDEQEHDGIQQQHLDLIRGLLLSDTDTFQQKLFFWAYDFDIIPIELISSIYEEFYHKDVDTDDRGTHYTPSVLVEFVLSHVLTKDILSKTPKILDPACGSGIFLVEAFRRIVRYQSLRKRRNLNPEELRAILSNQLTGIEIYQEAARVATFSLYLALLHYQEPPDILGSRLPNLLHQENSTQDNNHYSTIICADSFWLIDSERDDLKEMLHHRKRFKGRRNIEHFVQYEQTLPIEPASFDIIIGNPPWGKISTMAPTLWAKAFRWSIGDKELSQAFISRTLALLKPHGQCGLLVSTGVLLKRHENSQKFRQRWLQEVTLKTVVNFAHVRHIFFSAIAPFAFVYYTNSPPSSSNRFQYWSAKKVDVSKEHPEVVLTHADIHGIEQIDVLLNDYLWKVYWWGNHQDARLIKSLKMYPSLGEVANENGWTIGQGFQNPSPTSKGNKYSDWLQSYQQIKLDAFDRYGNISIIDNLFSTPNHVFRFGNKEIYSGWRILLAEGIMQSDGSNGRIKARLESIDYCFTDSIYGISLKNATVLQRKIIIAIIWSSLARYYFFMIASSWGTWNHKIQSNEFVTLPTIFPSNEDLQYTITILVDKLMDVQIPYSSSQHTLSDVKYLEKELDQAIFDLYQLTESERDLIRDMCEYGLDFFYNDKKSIAVKSIEYYPKEQGIFNQLPTQRAEQRGLEGYLYTFLERWNQELEGLGEFSWHIVRPHGIPMIALIFTTQEFGTDLSEINISDDQVWQNVLSQLDETLKRPISQRIFIEGMVRVVTDTDIYIIKRDEERLWTRSAAHEDIEATLLQAMRLQESIQDKG